MALHVYCNSCGTAIASLQKYMSVRDAEGMKKEASKVKTNNKARQHSTPKVFLFPKNNELPRVGFEPTTLYTLD